jgi:hypothetical protein
MPVYIKKRPGQYNYPGRFFYCRLSYFAVVSAAGVAAAGVATVVVDVATVVVTAGVIGASCFLQPIAKMLSKNNAANANFFMSFTSSYVF